MSSTVKTCQTCETLNAKLLCSRCQKTSYCSKECQKRDWKTHKLTCRPRPPTMTTKTNNNNDESEQDNCTIPVQPLDLEWIRDAVVDEGTIANLEYGEEEVHPNGSQLMDQRDEFMDDIADGKADKKVAMATIHRLQTILSDETIIATAEALISMWDRDTIDEDMQKAMKQRVERATRKAQFILFGILLEALKNKAWSSLHSKVMDMCFSILRKLLELSLRVPHPRGSVMPPVLKHFKTMDFLREISLTVWSSVIMDSKIKLSSSQIGEFIPLMRQLCMVNCLDKDLNMYGSWDDVLNELSHQTCRRGFKRIKADEHLEKVTNQLRKACNSLRCKMFAAKPSNIHAPISLSPDDAPQQWKYFPKCSHMGCNNIETKEKPHELRCRKCWYFHWCSEACETLSCHLSSLHDLLCSKTPAKKAKQTKKEMEAFLEIGKMSSHGSEKTCYGCGLKEKGDIGNNFIRGGRHDNVWYCSVLCDKWDREEGGYGN